jgi:hypothetical protein
MPHSHAAKEKPLPSHLVFQAVSANSGSEWLRSINSSTETSLGPSAGSLFVQALGHSDYWMVAYRGVTGPAQPAPVVQATQPIRGREHDGYDSAFVAEILAADAAPEEVGFDNVVDLLDWLNRD